MDIAMVGLGRMGANMTRRLANGGARVRAYDVSAVARAALQDEALAQTCDSLEALVAAPPAPRIVWLMLPSGEISEQSIAQLLPLLQPGDTLVDGANAYYKDAIRRARECATRGIEAAFREGARRGAARVFALGHVAIPIAAADGEVLKLDEGNGGGAQSVVPRRQ